MSDNINVIVTRPVHLMGRRIEAGASLRVAALEAHALVGAGKAQLRDETDAAAVQQAVQADNFGTARNTPGFMPNIRDPRW